MRKWKPNRTNTGAGYCIRSRPKFSIIPTNGFLLVISKTMTINVLKTIGLLSVLIWFSHWGFPCLSSRFWAKISWEDLSWVNRKNVIFCICATYCTLSFPNFFDKIGALKNDAWRCKMCGHGRSDWKCEWQLTHRKSCSFAGIIRSFVQTIAKMPVIW